MSIRNLISTAIVGTVTSTVQSTVKSSFQAVVRPLAAAAVIATVSFGAAAQNLDNGFDSLGGNEKIIKRAKALNSSRTVRIVQNRTVDRTLRLEAGVLYGGVAGGDSYLNTSNFGGQLEFHLTPQWSVGGRYISHSNELTSEGDARFEAARANKESAGQGDVPVIDYPVNTTLGTVTWYPLYGKINFFDMSVVQFDIYALGGAGQIKLNSGSTETFTAGGGVGFWLAQHVSTRFEMRWQTYEDNATVGTRRLNLTVATLGLGVLF